MQFDSTLNSLALPHASIVLPLPSMVNDLEIAKGNINSILLKKDSINKKSPAIALEFESTDS